jgi:hypothetical protein
MGGCVSICGSKNNPAITTEDVDPPATPAGDMDRRRTEIDTLPRTGRNSPASSFRVKLPRPGKVTSDEETKCATGAGADLMKLMACTAEFSSTMKQTLEHLDDHGGEAPSLKRQHKEMAALLITVDAVCRRHGIELDPLKADTDITGILNAAAGIAQPQLQAGAGMRFSKATEALRVLRHEMNATPHLRDIAPEHRFRLCIDPVKLADLQRIAPSHANVVDNPLIGFLFDNEPGYLHATAQAWQSAMGSIDEPITSEAIMTLNALATGHGSAKTKPYATSSRSFGMQSGRTFSPDGEAEVRQYVSDSAILFQTLGAHMIQSLKEAPFSDDLQLECLASLKSNHDVVVKHHLSAYRNATGPGSGKGTQLPAEKLAYASIDLAQKLERLHPFEDGNCRTFTILLNKLLVGHGLRISMMDNPNKLDGFSRAEVFQLLSEGQARVDGWRTGIVEPNGQTLNSLAVDSQAMRGLEDWLYPGTSAHSGATEDDDIDLLFDFTKTTEVQGEQRLDGGD